MQRACMRVCVCGYLLFFLSLPAIQKCKMTVLHSLRFPHYLGSVWYVKCVWLCCCCPQGSLRPAQCACVCVCVYIWDLNFGAKTLKLKERIKFRSKQLIQVS